ncbi:Cytochrome c oxidase subunit 5b-2 [Morus notabilis]|uniref:Cytochrome c oxidase subunit 5b-2 n=1 Tax=Morus notabilis TaxID=981085 RepID=W9STS0_9ROSA|nr:cytochrome c oxidase subunit 5b-2, mitochondrial [Morus notabilis]EXC26035.1 Cytochrome c oxidase subunit 5b-2 [Morus notabilis]
MWRRVVSLSSAYQLQNAPWRSSTLDLSRRFLTSVSSAASSSTTPFQRSAALSSPLAATASDKLFKRSVEDIMPIATGHEREELQAELEGRDILEINYPVGPFGTKGEPAVVKSFYDKRIVGCPGGEGEDEHDVVWFWLEKGKPHECPVCSQHFMLKVVGPGGPPDGHGDHNHH